MAKSKYPTVTEVTVQTEQTRPQPAQLSAPVERELLINFYPCVYSQWEGSSAQLRDEGLIPEDIKWPTGTRDQNWSCSGFSYWLKRTRPDGIKGPMSLWANGDWWMLRRSLENESRDAYLRSAVDEARRAYEHALWRQTPEYSAHFNRYWKAHEDKNFQSFMANAKGEGESCKQKQAGKSAMG